MSASAEDLEALQNELTTLRLEREKESQKEKEVMRGLIAKIQELTSENKMLKDHPQIEQDLVGMAPKSIASDSTRMNGEDINTSDSTKQLATEQTAELESKATLDIENSNLKSDLSKAQRRLSELQDELDMTRSANEELQKQNRNAAQSASKQVSGLEEMAEQRLSTIKELEADIIALRNENSKLKNSKTDDNTKPSQEKEVSEMKARITELSTQISRKDTEVETLQKDLTELRKSQAESEERGKKYVAVLNKTKKQILKLEKEKVDAVEELNLFKSEMSATKEELAQTMKKLAERESEVAVQTSRITQQQSEISILQKERKEANEAQMEIRDELQIKQAEYESSQSRVEDLEMKIKESERQLDEFNDRIAALEEQLSNSEARRERLQENEKLLVQRNADQISVVQQKLERAFGDAKAEKDRLEQMKTAFEKKAEEDSIHIEKLKSELATAILQSEEMSKIVSHSAEELKDAQRQTQELEASLSKVQEDSKLMSNKVDQLTQELNQIKNWASAIRKEKEDIEKQLEESRVKELHVKSMNKALKEEIKKVTRATPVSQMSTSPTSSRSASPIAKPSSPPSTAGIREDISMHNKLVNTGNGDAQTSGKEPLNLEYLKHIVIGFMENKQARTQLIPVLSMLLKLSPEDVKRLQAAS